MTTPLAAPPGGNGPPADSIPAGAALSELEPGELLFEYDSATKLLSPHVGPGDPEFDRWLKLHSEIMTRLAREYAARTSG